MNDWESMMDLEHVTGGSWGWFWSESDDDDRDGVVYCLENTADGLTICIFSPKTRPNANNYWMDELLPSNWHFTF